MVTLKKYNLEGKELGTVDVKDMLANAEANGQMIKDYIVAIRENRRQWSANTKTRSEVAHTTAKPHPQKGTGRARHGNLVGPQFRGGGIVFGPKPKFDQHVRINKKERRAAIRALLADKIREGKFIIIESVELEAPKTKSVATFIKNCEISGRTLFLGETTYSEVETDGKKERVSVKATGHDNFAKSINNLPKAEFALASNISGYDVMNAGTIIATESALKELEDWLC
ncbi:MAG: 50S ribosomal protein L4 [Chlamydiales bacterium]|nr:50S ribosomal protein L4 [Chlamydiia bacterium]MCP5506902.1 50S ribosomal protein L4 [Chlamydiales bacterium]